MKKRILIFSLSLLLCLLVGGCKEKTPCEKDGHTWNEATYVAPKTCSVCGETEGEKLVETFATVEAAMDEVNLGNFTMVMSTSSSVEEQTNEAVVTIKLAGDYAITDTSAAGMTITVFTETIDNSVYSYVKLPTDGSWVYQGKTSVEEGNASNGSATNVDITENMFTFTNGMWVGNAASLNKVLDNYLSVFAEQYENAGMSVDNMSVSRYDIKLNNGKLDKIYLDFSMTLSMSGESITLSAETVSTYSNIGTTVVEKPANLPTAE